MSASDMSVAEITGRIEELVQELERRRKQYIATIAPGTALTKSQIESFAQKGRQSFGLPLTDWAAVMLYIADQKRELAKKRCLQFWPLVSPEFEPSEAEEQKKYLTLFS